MIEGGALQGLELRLFIEQAPVAAAMFDGKMRYLAASSRWLRERDLDATVLGRSAYDFHPDADAKLRGLHTRALSGEPISRVEHQLEVPYGTLEWVRWEMRPWRDAERRIGGIIVFAEDITAQKRAEESLSLSEQRYRTALDAASQEIAERKKAEQALRDSTERLNLAQSAAQIGIWDWNTRTNEAYVNDQWYLLHGIAKGAPVSYEDFVARLHPEDSAGYLEMVQRAFSGGGSIDGSCKIIRLDDGAIRWLRSKGEVSFDRSGRPIRAMGAVWDITELKEAQDALLQRSEDRYRRIVETAQEGIWLIGADAKTNFVNPKMGEMLGYSCEDMLGRELLEFMDEEWKPLARKKLADRSSGVVEVHDFKFRRKNGSELWALLSCTPIFEGGNYIGALAMVMDFTERKRLDEERRQYLEKLKHADRKKDEFLATLGHELRTPLATIKLAMDLIQQGCTKPAEMFVEYSSLVERTQRQVRHLVRIVEDILQTSRVSRGMIELKEEEIDLDQLLTQILEDHQAKFEQQGLTLKVNTAKEAPLRIRGDSVRLTQVFGNLLDNAKKYTDRGGTVALTSSRSIKDAVVTVRDTGIGIPPQELSSIFELFNQMKHGHERRREGIGVGLALARKLVELHEGSIEARSGGPGKGSEFVVRLPLMQEGNEG